MHPASITTHHHLIGVLPTLAAPAPASTPPPCHATPRGALLPAATSAPRVSRRRERRPPSPPRAAPPRCQAPRARSPLRDPAPPAPRPSATPAAARAPPAPAKPQ